MFHYETCGATVAVLAAVYACFLEVEIEEPGIVLFLERGRPVVAVSALVVDRTIAVLVARGGHDQYGTVGTYHLVAEADPGPGAELAQLVELLFGGQGVTVLGNDSLVGVELIVLVLLFPERSAWQAEVDIALTVVVEDV